MGASADSAASHRRFKEKYHLPFALLADTDSRLRQAFGAESRTSFLIGSDGSILKVWPKVSVSGHAAEVYASLP